MSSKHSKSAPTGHARNTLSTTQTPSFKFGSCYPLSGQTFEFGRYQKPQAKAPEDASFRVPSPTESEEEELEALENSLPEFNPDYNDARDIAAADTHSERLSDLGDSSSLFDCPSGDFTFRSSPASTSMVVEREPPKAPLSPRKVNEQSKVPPFGQQLQQPQFGKASPLQNRLSSNHVFNIPKPHKAHPEFHRPAQPVFQNPNAYGQRSENSLNPAPPKSNQTIPPAPQPAYALQSNGDIVEIPKPSNFPPQPTYAKPPPVFSSHAPSAFTAVNQYARPSNVVDLTAEPALFDDKFGAADPYEYIDAGKATDNIKALLEGAFEEEEDKPRTRGRKKKVQVAVDKLSDKLQSLKVKAEENEGEEIEAEEEEEDDGTIEGLKVKLLPHQVEGVEWMRDKETTQKKTKGVLPKGGILADDVRSLSASPTILADWNRWALARPYNQYR